MIAASPLASKILERVRARARLQALWMAELWRADQTSPDQGLAISSGEAARHLSSPELQSSAREAFEAARADAAALKTTAEAADAALAADPDWRAMAADFALTAPELDLLALALAQAMEPDLGRVFAYLQDDGQATHPTPLLAARMHGWSEPFAPEGLLRWRLAGPLDGGSPALPATAWIADASVAGSIASGRWSDPALGEAARLVESQEVADLLDLHAASLEALKAAAEAPGRPLQIDLCGPEGVGRQTVAARFAAGLGRPLLALDARALLARQGASPADVLAAGLRMARRLGAIPYWRSAEAFAADDLIAARPLADLVICGWPEAGPFGPVAGARSISLKPLHTPERLALWRSHCASEPPKLIGMQRLTAAEIVRAARAAPAGTEAIRTALRRSAPPQDDLLALLPTPYAWDDLVAPPDLDRQLHELASQIELRWAVYEDWGFERTAHLGRGVAALFGGPSGVGKTMAAQVIARELQLDIYRVDLAGVVNKYVGETEKRLRSVFDYCERAGCLLFFDEADALFGSRMQVKDAHDRFANIEIDYLLQRIETFDGVTILATNRKNELDSGFLRRLRVVIDFLPPGPEERLKLWRKALHEQSPSGETIIEGIDWEFLAERLSLTGADIKAAALGAAFLARAETSKIGMRHVLAAAQREMSKQGHVLRAPLREAAP